MAKVNFKISLQKLLDNELSSSSNDKKQVISGYKSLIDILKVPQIGKQLHGYHELLFECISQIFLTPFNQFFDDNQLRSLLELASNACVLSMSQNQIIDGWLQNIEERTFEKPDNDEDEEDDDDDDLYEDATESEEEEEEEKIMTIRDNNKRSNRGAGNQRQQNDSNLVSLKEKNPPLTRM
jgi:Ran GTPase-activating protein (RanGAP) involved in mRNA processing and transport